MNAQELRIGNLTNLGVVYKIDVNKFYVRAKDGKSFGSSWAKIEPIPLTEEWILSLGFHHVTDNEYAIDDQYTINLYPYASIFFICSYMHMPPSVRIKYVHELQNLYFALSKKELKRII